jgi:hypothetical protein
MPSATECPLCGENNSCAAALGKPENTCWCVTEQFPPDLLEHPTLAAARDRCVCANCLDKARRQQDAR